MPSGEWLAKIMPLHMVRYALGLGLTPEARARVTEFRPHVAHFTVCDLLGMDGVRWAKQNNVAMVAPTSTNATYHHG